MLVLRGLWHQYRPQRRHESVHDWMARRHTGIRRPLWTDGT